MRSTSRTFAAIAAAALLATLTGAAQAATGASVGATLQQIRNGVGTATTTPAASWVTGNAGGSNSHYLESHSIGYRTILTGLPTNGTVITLTLDYAAKKSGSYAIDYLTQYQRLLPHVTFAHTQPEVINPLDGISGVSSLVTTAPIPLPTVNSMIDPDGTGSDPAVPQPSTSMSLLPDAERVMTLFGGTLIDVTYVTQGDMSLTAGTSDTQVNVRFTANSATAVLAWGGHIASRWDWGFNADGTPRSAGGISGSSYHMSLVGWSLGSLGSQDRSLSTDAVIAMPQCGISNAGPFCANTNNTHVGPTGMQAYQWSLFNNTSGATIVGSDTSKSVVVNAGTSGGSYGLLLVTTENTYTKQCQITVNVNAPATADAGVDQRVCATSPQVTLAGVATGGTGAWSGGAGTFNPNAQTMNAVYTPTATEIAAGSVTLTLTTTVPGGTCPPASDQMKITIDKASTANAGADIVVCASNPRAQLAGVVGGGAATGTWSGGAGVFTPNASALNATYDPTPAEIAAGSVTLTLTTTATGGACAVASDDVKITINPIATVNAGSNVTVCTSSPAVQLAGVVGGGAATGTWSGGAGTFNPNASTLNATYTPAAAELAAGGVTLTLTTNDPAGPCGPATATMHITYAPAATANAGADVVVCSTSPAVTLAGVVGGGASSGTWSGGAGTFNPDASTLNATYTPSAAEIAAGTVTLTLTTNATSGPCGQVSDQMVISIKPAATVNAGQDVTVCTASPAVQLAGAVGGGASTGTWSGGAGTFNPSASTLNATYTPTAAEMAAGSVTLTLTTNDPAGPCGAVSAAMHINYTPAATANAGADVVVCSTSPQVTLAGMVGGGASSGTWSGGGGTFNPNASALNATYTPSAAEIAAGTVTLTLTSNAVSGPCGQASDQMVISIKPAATVSAGQGVTVCTSSPAVQLAGVVGGGASTGTWSGGAGTFNPNASTLNATYTPTAAEMAAGSVTLTLTTNDPAGPCGAVSDAMQIKYVPAATANAGVDVTVCSSAPQVTLAGVVGGGASSGTWSGGGGTFSPNASTLNATYTPSAAEIAAGSVTLTLTTNATSGPCAQATDQVKITILPAATVAAGADRTVCTSSPVVQLAGVVGGGASTGTWSGGAGTFSPNASTLNATYAPTAAEMAAGSVTLTLTTNDPAGPCGAVSAAMHITYSPAATVDAGLDQSVCSSAPQVLLAGVLGGGASGGTWTGGSGTFSPNASAPNAKYTPSAAEIAAGTVTLTLTTAATGGPCPQVSDQMTITILPAATVNAGLDQVVCSTSPNVVLAGVVGGGASSGTWSGGTGTYSPSASALNATYTPSLAEIVAGSVTLTLTTNDPAGPCGAVSDQMKITINAIAVVNAGPGQSVCANSPRVQLAGSVTGGATTGTWSGGAGTYSPNASTLNAQYTPSAAEITAGSVTLTLTSAATGGPCPPVSDRMTITIYPAPSVNAGPDQAVCAGTPSIQLAGTIGGSATSATWTGGTGSFTPGPTALNATYAPTAADVAAGTVTLTLTTNDPSGPCGAVSDQMVITLDQPVVTVNDQAVCYGVSPMTLTASVSHGIPPYTYRWSNGAATPSITVADTGIYTVQVTDAKGCMATDAGRFYWRQCTGVIAHTSTTCNQFMAGTAAPIVQGDLHWATSNNIISTISPGVFFYFTDVRAPRPDFTIVIQQILTDPRFPFCDVFQGQVSLYDQNCGNLGTGVTTSAGQASVDIHGATPGQVFVVGVKYSLKSLIGTYMDPTMGCHYDFHTVVDGLVVDADPDGFWIGVPQLLAGSGSGTPPDPAAGDGTGTGTGGDGIIMRGGHGTGGASGPTTPGGAGGGTASTTGGRASTLGAGTMQAQGGASSNLTPLERPVPNPFTSGMHMAFAVSKDGDAVDISVYDITGRHVKTLASGVLGPGVHDVAWDGSDASGLHVRRGMYFIHIRIGDQARQVRVTFVN